MRIFNATSSVNITGINQFIVCNSQDPIELTLTRSATGSHGVYHIKNIGVGVVTITPQETDAIDGVSARSLNQYDSISMMDYDSNIWIITSNNYVAPIS